MSIVQVANISVSFGAFDVLKDVSLNLSPGVKIALTGANGSGKSTLMKVIAGLLPSDRGTIVATNDARVAYLPQSGLTHAGSTLTEEADTAFAHYIDVEQSIRDIESRLADTKEQDSHTHDLLTEHHALSEHLEQSGFHTRESRIERVLIGLGFDREDFGRLTDEFSGGWQMRIALAKVLLSNPDVLLLDEPTNYLDLEARNWLEGFLGEYRGSTLIVSHDRYFLDTTVSTVAELFMAKMKIYKGNFSAYEAQRKQELDDLLNRYRRQQEEIARIEFFIRRFRYKATKAVQVQDRVKSLERLERIEIPESMKKINIRFPKPPRSGDDVLVISDLGKSYGDLKALKNVNLTLNRKERLAVVGKNGAGKSTLLKAVSGTLADYVGEVRYGTGVLPGYFAQDLDDPGAFAASDAGNRIAQSPATENSVIDALEAIAPTNLVPQLRGMLGAFLFRGDDIYKSVSVLSGGERSRLELLKLLLNPINLLILDEPTNHLDLNSKEVLLEALHMFDGTILFVSHDRFFIEQLATSVLELEDGEPTMYPGDYGYYLWRKSQVAADGQDMPTMQAEDSRETGTEWHIEKKRKSTLKRLQRAEEALVSELERLAVEQIEIEKSMADPDVYIDGTRMKALAIQLKKNAEAQAQMTMKWETLEEEIAELT